MTMLRKRFEIALAYNWPLFIILPVCAGLAISYLFGVYHQPLPYEKINLFVASLETESEAISENIQAKFADQNLKEVSITTSNPSDAIFNQKLKVVGYNRADLFLLPLSVLDDLTPSDVMLPFSEELIATYINGEERTYYIEQQLTFGVLLKSTAENSWLDEYINFVAEDYYLCINVKSKNVADFGMYDNAEYDLALQTFSYLLGGGQ
jgi:hypothetical protein